MNMSISVTFMEEYMVCCFTALLTPFVGKYPNNVHLFTILAMWWRPFWIFAFSEKRSTFTRRHTTDLDSAGQNLIETAKKHYIYKNARFILF